ncbi:MAG: ABC transporter permease [Defluviitaleaceae bacterium]|nr:ABC transporter permease [Defluviitaleaceae bacterium]MCL2224916.1 ABC transporter permease [Defluviitaleaceae bacterium]MCL2262522.1 ABC transporter permease [Defluviitaleaceae bacterium]
MFILQFFENNWIVMQGAVSLGIIFSLMAMGVFLAFRILEMPDLSVEGSIILGAGMSARLISGGMNPFLATLLSVLVGSAAGFCTGFLHTKLKIPSILAGILTMVAAYSVVFRIMGANNVPLLPHGPQRVTSVFTFLQDWGLSRPNAIILLSVVVVVVVSALLYCFMGTEFGSAIRATGNNRQMVKAQGINTDIMIIACLMLSNGMVALAGSLWAQQQGFASVDMGIGTIVIGLASVIIAEVIFRPRRFWTSLIAIVIGSIIYRLIIALALSVDFMRSTDLRLVTAVIVAFALCLPLLRDNIAKLRKFIRNRGNT